MRLPCHFVGHLPATKPIWNNGYHFSRCKRCNAEVIRSSMSRRWKNVPSGYRIEWRPMEEFDIRW